jgi:hypothetical protein
MKLKKTTGEVNYNRGEADRIRRFVKWFKLGPEKWGCINEDVEEGSRCNSTDSLFLDWCEPCQIWAINQNLEEIANNRGRECF